MRTHRFGRKIELPATIAIKHQLRKLMFEDSVKKAKAAARAEVFRGQPSEELLVNASIVSGPFGSRKEPDVLAAHTSSLCPTVRVVKQGVV
jgi:hypothetical protein